MSSIAIVIPAHNEEKRIGKTLEEYIHYFKKLSSRNLKFKIIVVINASTDRTSKIVEEKKNKILSSIEFLQGGKGFAVREGFTYALNQKFDYIGFVDADMSTTPQEFYRLYKEIKNDDGVIASRYLKGAKLTPKNTFFRVTASRIYNFFIRSIMLIPYRDTQCGAKIFTSNSISKIINKMGITSWAFDVEMLYLLNKNGFKVKEVPTEWSNKDYSKINFWKSGPWMAMAILRLRLLNSPFKEIVRAYDKFIRYFKPAK